MSETLLPDLPPFEACQRDSQRIGWLHQAVEELHKKLLEAQNAHALHPAVTGRVARASAGDALVERFGAVEAQAIRERLGLTEKFTRPSLDKICEIYDTLGKLPSDAEMQLLLSKLATGRYYHNIELQAAWSCDGVHMSIYRYMLQKLECLQMMPNYGWKKIKNNIPPIKGPVADADSQNH